MGSVFGDYCEKCGQRLICEKCHGTGEVGENVSTTFCCGEMRNSSYCPACGKSLQSSYSKKSKCPDCIGTGRRFFHTC